MCVPAPSGIRSWLSPAMHFGVVSDSCELLLSALPCRTAAIAAAASAATWAKPCSIFTRHLVDVAKSKKGPLLVFCPYSLIWVIKQKRIISTFLRWFWEWIILLGIAQKWQESAIIADNLNPILHSVCCCSSLANSPHVQSHVHSPTDRNVLCTRAKHVEAYGSWLRCDGGAE